MSMVPSPPHSGHWIFINSLSVYFGIDAQFVGVKQIFLTVTALVTSPACLAVPLGVVFAAVFARIRTTPTHQRFLK